MLSWGYLTEKRFRRNVIISEHAAPGAFFCQSAPSYVLPSNLADKDIPPLRCVKSKAQHNMEVML
jgi:hypothetical protein